MESIPDELKRLIFANIESIDQLRILLLLQADPDRDWSPLAVCTRLYLQPEVAQKGLEMLQRKGFVTVDATDEPLYRYQPLNAELVKLVDTLVELDRTRPVTLISLIYARTKDPLQSFADSFKLRKDT